MADANGVYQQSVIRSVPAVSDYSFRLYVWVSGDRPDLVAYETLGNSSLWWAILDINPELINPQSIPAGTVVRIPVQPVLGQGTLIQ